jgi:hypothetical protein
MLINLCQDPEGRQRDDPAPWRGARRVYSNLSLNRRDYLFTAQSMDEQTTLIGANASSHPQFPTLTVFAACLHLFAVSRRARLC